MHDTLKAVQFYRLVMSVLQTPGVCALMLTPAEENEIDVKVILETTDWKSALEDEDF